MRAAGAVDSSFDSSMNPGSGADSVTLDDQTMIDQPTLDEMKAQKHISLDLDANYPMLCHVENGQGFEICIRHVQAGQYCSKNVGEMLIEYGKIEEKSAHKLNKLFNAKRPICIDDITDVENDNDSITSANALNNSGANNISNATASSLQAAKHTLKGDSSNVAYRNYIISNNNESQVKDSMETTWCTFKKSLADKSVNRIEFANLLIKSGNELLNQYKNQKKIKTSIEEEGKELNRRYAHEEHLYLNAKEKYKKAAKEAENLLIQSALVQNKSLVNGGKTAHQINKVKAKLDKKILEALELVKQSENDCQEAVASFRSHISKYNASMTRSLGDLQILEAARIEETKRTLLEIMKQMNATNNQYHNIYSTLNDVIEAINVDNDIELFVKRHKCSPVKEIQFKCEVSALVREEITHSQSSLNNYGKSLNESEYNTNSPVKLSNDVSTPTSASSSVGGNSKNAFSSTKIHKRLGSISKRAEANIKSWRKTAKDKINKTLKRDVVSTHVQEGVYAQNDYASGSSNPYHGDIAPKPVVKPATKPMSPINLSPANISRPTYPIPQVKVLYKYAPTEEGELEINVNDIIINIIENEDGWHEGYNTSNDTFGCFPSNYVSETFSAVLPSNVYYQPPRYYDETEMALVDDVVVLDDMQEVEMTTDAPTVGEITSQLKDVLNKRNSERVMQVSSDNQLNTSITTDPDDFYDTLASPVQIITKAQVMYDFEARNEEEMSIKEGQIVEIYGVLGEANEWLHAYTTDHRFEGKVPSSYLEVITSSTGSNGSAAAA